ncbi:MAG: 1-hydroxycarotenoid 3,4-desaturase CrtD [Paracoccaceae bacterium]
MTDATPPLLPGFARARAPAGPRRRRPVARTTARDGGTRALTEAFSALAAPRPPSGSGDRTVVVGAGFGGLAAALRLAAEGREVVVLERAARVGGKARTVEAGGRAVDAGPTVFTMRWVFEELFAAAGADLDAAVGLTPARVLARHAWADGSRFDLHADLDETAEAVAALAGPAEADRYRAFARATERAYHLFRPAFIEAPRPTPLDVLARIGLRGIPDLFAVRPAANLFAVIADQLHDDRLRQLFARYATYCGSSPYRAPATLALIAHVERVGVWQVAGGMGALARAIAGLAVARGAAIRTGVHVEAIETEGGRVAGVRLAGGERIACGAVVFNGDAGALGAGRLGEAAARAVRRIAPERRSLSAVVFSAHAEARGFPLSHHTIFFGPDYRAEFDAMAAGRPPRDATTYVCALDRDAADGPAPSGPERLHVQINAPARGDTHPMTTEEIETCRRETEALMRRAGLTLSLSTRTTVTTTPADFERLFPGTGGALYGEATHGPNASFFRAGTRTRLKGLYLAGGSTHPGAGVPMAALSGKLAAEALSRDRASTPRFRPAATPGGISTPSPTTGSTG